MKATLVVASVALALPAVLAIIRADRRVPYDTLAKTLLLIRGAGFSEVYLAIRRPDSPISEDYLLLRY